MSGTAVPLSNTANGYTIVSQVLSPSSEPGQVISSVNPVRKFLKGWPKTLGAVQIMIGLLAVILGILWDVDSLYGETLVFNIPAFVVAIVHITTGVLTAAAGYKLRLCLVRAALVMNVINSAAAVIAIIMFSLYFEGQRPWDRVKTILAMLLIISIIQFIISICVSSFAGRASWSTGPYVNITVVANPEGGSMVNPFPAPHKGEYPLSTVNTTTVNSPPMDSPPPYSEIKGYPDY